MSRCVIVAKGVASGVHCPHEDQYLKSFDFEYDDGSGLGHFIEDIGLAKVFANPGAAVEFWQTQSRVRPLRDDGRPNRPLSCLNIGIEHVE